MDWIAVAEDSDRLGGGEGLLLTAVVKLRVP